MMYSKANWKVDHLFGHPISNTARCMHRALQRNFSKEGYAITSEQWVVLASLYNEDGLTQNEICEATLKDKASITRIMANMEKCDLLTRISDPTDGRSKRAFLTKYAKKIEQQLLHIAERTALAATRNIPADDLMKCREVLNKITANLK